MSLTFHQKDTAVDLRMALGGWQKPSWPDNTTLPWMVKMNRSANRQVY